VDRCGPPCTLIKHLSTINEFLPLRNSNVPVARKHVYWSYLLYYCGDLNWTLKLRLLGLGLWCLTSLSVIYIHFIYLSSSNQIQDSEINSTTLIVCSSLTRHNLEVSLLIGRLHIYLLIATCILYNIGNLEFDWTMKDKWNECNVIYTTLKRILWGVGISLPKKNNITKDTIKKSKRSRCDRDRMVVGFTTTYATSVFEHLRSNPIQARCIRYNIMW
jgi:hypothetical protein